MNLLMPLMNGITYGGLLFMCASGLTLVFGLMRIVNLSHGILYVLGAYLGLTIERYTHSWLLAVIGGAVGVAIIGGIMHLKLLKKLKGHDTREVLLTLGISFFLADLLLAIYGGLPQNIPEPSIISRPLNLGFMIYPGYRIFVVLVAILIGIGLWLLMKKTHLGQIIRAGVDDKDIVSSLGINIDKIFTMVFMLAAFLAGLSGVIGGSYRAFAPESYFSILTYSLIVVIMGGLGSLRGAALGALLVGLIDSFSKIYMPEMSMVFLFGSLMLVLAFRPYGLLGRE